MHWADFLSEWCPMTYNRRQLLKELDALVSKTPRIRLSEVAHSLGVDRHTIENRSISFREYKRNELMQMAQALLGQQDVSVKEVGIRLGYSSAASFSRFVTKSTGKSPSRLRKQSMLEV